MYSIVFLGVVSFVCALLLTPLVRDCFLRLSLVDAPGDPRKIHSHAVPRVGGIAILLSYVLAFGILLVSPLKGSHLVHARLSFVWKLLPAIGVIFIVGLLDDLFGLKPWKKLVGQVTAGVLAFYAGVQIHGVLAHPLQSPWSVLVTVFWLVACTNAFNLIDGMDGLATGAGLFAAVSILVGGLLNDSIVIVAALVPLVGALSGFLRYNFQPASIFLGDCGSLTLGFLLGCYAVIWSAKSTTILGMTAPLMALALPLLDTGLAIVRRLVRKQPIFGADRGHIHHRLLDRGLTPRRVVLLLYGVSGLGAIFALLQTLASKRLGGLIIILFCVVAWMGVQQLGYVEFGLARRMFLQGTFRGMINAQILLLNFERDVTAATTFDGCWETVREACRTFGFNQARLRLGDKEYEERFVANGDVQEWEIHVSIPPLAQAVLTRECQSSGYATIVAPFVHSLHRALSTRLVELETEAQAAAAAGEDGAAVEEDGNHAQRVGV